MSSDIKREKVEQEVERLMKQLSALQKQYVDAEAAIKYHVGAIEFAKSLLVEPKAEGKVIEMPTAKIEPINEEALKS